MELSSCRSGSRGSIPRRRVAAQCDFAQFEREITADRTDTRWISGRKSALDGGQCALRLLGGKQVVPLKKEAAQVHFMFERFADRPSLSEQAGALQCTLNGGYSLSRAN